MNWADFFHMGGYAFYVWTSWAVTITLMIVLVVTARLRKRQLIEQLRQKHRREQLQKAAPSSTPKQEQQP
ncbi:MAG: heme exporter protein CcmD [Arenicella sp.]